MSDTTPQLPPLLQPLPQIRLANWGPRMAAFFMDVVLVGMLSAFILVKFLLPQEHPEGFEAYRDTLQSYEPIFNAALEEGKLPSSPVFENEEAIQAMATYILQTLLLFYFLYFGGCEWLMRGSSMGKRTFGIRSAVIGTALPPTALQALLRGATKAFALFAAPPFSWVILLMALFMSGRRGGHDILARTAVIEEPVLESPEEA